MKTAKKIQKLPERRQQKPEDCWDLSSLFADDAAWEEAFVKWEGRIAEYEQFQGKLGDDPASLAACLAIDLDLDRRASGWGTTPS